MPSPLKVEEEVPPGKELVMSTEGAARPKLHLATICREYRSPTPGNRGSRSRFHPLHQKGKELVAKLISDGLLEPLPEVRKPVGDDPLGSEPASTPREQKTEVREVEEARVKTEPIENTKKTR